jgi:hypothetical protein
MSNSQWHGGKGSGRRAAAVPDAEVAARWDAIFGNKKNKKDQKTTQDKETPSRQVQ